MPRLTLIVPSVVLCLATLSARAVDAEGVAEDKSAVHTLKPYDRKADTTPADSPSAAAKSFRRAKIPAGFQASLWATEPLLSNPVAFSFDGQGRMYIAETHRYRTSVLDIRHYMFMLEDDLANRNQSDWEKSIKKNFPNDWQDLGKETEVVRLVEDTNNDGVADKTSVYADGFNSILDGIASGVLARPDGVWLANIPGLYKLSGKGPDGKAQKKEEVFRGFGIRFNYTGHDLHGLIKGPDGRLYFSIGDRGTSVKTKEGTMLEVPDEGAIFRCEEDGSHLELVMRGLRNPQELAFDDYGNLFACDNDSDQGDRERFVYVVEGGDAGWRIGYQHCPQPAERNPWLAEHMWEPRDPAKNQPAYILSPLANLPDGPGGFVHYPGTGLPDKYNGCFFLACYKGSSQTSQVAVLKPVPDGASFKLEMLETFIPGCQATDVDFGPDSRLYVSFWDEGWERTAQGRILKVEHEEARRAQAAQIAEVQKLLGEGMKNRSNDDLIKLFGHKDSRVRLEAQWEIAGRPNVDLLLEATALQGEGLARLHAIWAWGIQERRLWHRIGPSPCSLDRRAPRIPLLLSDPDPVIREQTAKVLWAWPNPGMDSRYVALLKDESPRVRFTGMMGLSKANSAGMTQEAFDDYLKLSFDDALLHFAAAAFVRQQTNYTRGGGHFLKQTLWTYPQSIGLQALAALLTKQSRQLDAAEGGDLRASANLVAKGFLESASNGYQDMGLYLASDEPAVRREAARLITQNHIQTQYRRLSRQLLRSLDPDTGIVLEDPVVSLHSLNAAFRSGAPEDAGLIARYAGDSKMDPALRVEALRLLSLWKTPPARDQITGAYAPLPPRSEDPARAALGHLTGRLFVPEFNDLDILSATLRTIEKLNAADCGPWVRLVARERQVPPAARAQALHVLAAIGSPELADTLKRTIGDSNSIVRITAAGLLGKTDPIAAAKGLETALTNGTPEDTRAALTELALLTGAEADRILAEQLILLSAGKVPSIAKLELLEAAAKHEAPVVKEALAKYEASLPKDDLLAKFAACLDGGDATNGKRLFREHPVAACTRCHMIQKTGGEAGPALDGIASRKDRRYLLESILLPNAQIAESFRMVVCNMKDGTIKAGVLRAETADSVTIQTPGEEPEELKKSTITSRDALPSAMLPNMGDLLTKREIRDLVEFVATLKD